MIKNCIVRLFRTIMYPAILLANALNSKDKHGPYKIGDIIEDSESSKYICTGYEGNCAKFDKLEKFEISDDLKEYIMDNACVPENGYPYNLFRVSADSKSFAFELHYWFMKMYHKSLTKGVKQNFGGLYGVWPINFEQDEEYYEFIADYAILKEWTFKNITPVTTTEELTLKIQKGINPGIFIPSFGPPLDLTDYEVIKGAKPGPLQFRSNKCL